MKFLRYLRGQLGRWTLVKYLRYVRDYRSFQEQLRSANPVIDECRWSERFPILNDRLTSTPFDHHYTYHTAWAIRKILSYLNEVPEHHDFGSQIFFCGFLSAHCQVIHHDIRPPGICLDRFEVRDSDLTNLSEIRDGSLRSVSCMHVVEHIGLGRYGDRLDPEGDRKAMSELQRVLAPGGNLLFAVPSGRPRICFNAHRIYDFESVVSQFSDCDLVEFSLITDDPKDGILSNADPSLVKQQSYGCGCYWFRKRSPN